MNEQDGHGFSSRHTDSIIYGLRFTITAETKPRRGESAHVIEEPEIVDDHGMQSLSHSLHQLSEVPRQIGTWIRERKDHTRR